MRRQRLAAAGLLILGLLVAVTQFVIARPGTQDARTTADIRQLQGDIDAYARSADRLPRTLDEVVVGSDLRARLTGYGYQPTSGVPATVGSSRVAYQLCATFATDTVTGRNAGYGTDDPRRHPAGRACFTHTTYLGR